MLCLMCQVQQQCLTKEHVESFKQQMADVIRYANEYPENINRPGGNDDDDTGLIAGSLSDVVDVDGATHASVSVDVTRVGTTQPIPITLSVEAANDGTPHHVDNVSLTTAGPPTSALTPSADGRKPAGSLTAEMSSDAEYYTPLGSPDESRQSSAANTLIDDVSVAAVIGKVIN